MHVLQNFLNLKEPPSQGDWAQTGETFNYVFILRQHSGSHGDWAQTGETFNYVFILRQHSGIGILKIIVVLSAIYG